jgi:hypothetical protein
MSTANVVVNGIDNVMDYSYQVWGNGYASNSGSPGVWTSQTSDVPEASTWALTLIGFGGLGFAGYRRAYLKSATALFAEVETGRLSLITLKKTGDAR